MIVSVSASPSALPWTVYSPSDAESAGYISKTYYSYNGSSYASYDDSTLGSLGTLQPQEAIWIRSLGSYASAPDQLKLLIPAK